MADQGLPNPNGSSPPRPTFGEDRATTTTTSTQVLTTTTTTTSSTQETRTRPFHYYSTRNQYDNFNGSSTATTRYSSTQSNPRDHEFEKRNLRPLNGSNNEVNDDDDDDNAFKLNRANNILLKNSSSEDESANGERPNKLFPIQSERDELLRKVRAVLNKVSSVNYTRLRKRWLSLMPNGSEEADDGELRLGIHQIGEVLHLVIAKALDDTIYMHIYAGLMGYVVAKKSADISSKIRQLINAQLHHELQRLATDKELALFHRSTQLVDTTRRKKVTLHRLIAELYCEKACTSKFLYEKVTDLMIVNNPVDIDENVECLCVLMTFAGQKLEEAKKSWVEDIFTKLTQRQNERPETVSKRIQFMILDLIEMKTSGWSPHNKWWSPSVQRAPERERTRSSPTPSSNAASAEVRVSIAPLHHEELQLLQSSEEKSPNSKTGRRQGNKNRSRTRSEGSGLASGINNSGNGNVSGQTQQVTKRLSNTPNQNTAGIKFNTIPPCNSSSPRGKHGVQQIQQQQQPDRGDQNPNLYNPKSQPIRRTRELTQHQSRALMQLLNKVSPHNVDLMSYQLYEVLTQETLDEAITFIVDKFLDTTFYSRTHASLIFRTSCKPNMGNFGLKVGSRVMSILEKNPESKDSFQLLAELYNFNLVTIHQVRAALDLLMNCSTGMISAAIESLVMFLFISGAKLEADINDEVWMNRLIGFWEKKANLVAHNQGRPLCLLRDVIELRQNKWAPVRQPHWIPPTIDLPTIRFEPESLIRLFQSDRMEFLRFVKGETSSLSRIEVFCKDALQYGVRYGNYYHDPEFLASTGVCLRVLLQHQLLRLDRLERFLGTFMNNVLHMERLNSRAWNNWRVIMREVF